jgi:hypothetical protein
VPFFGGRAAVAPTKRIAIAKKEGHGIENPEYFHDWMTFNGKQMLGTCQTGLETTRSRLALPKNGEYPKDG